jgi:AcrR family transcriptional regulator
MRRDRVRHLPPDPPPKRRGARPHGGSRANSRPTAAETPDAAPRRRRRQSRAERSESTLRALYDAAAAVVGEVGYAEASVARITARAGVAQGTFYNYFESRQDLFDRLLPRLGQNMLDWIREQVDPGLRGAEREVARMRAYFRFLDEHPEFYRILYEAETLAPAAHARHMEIIAAGLVRSLGRSLERGEMPDGYQRRDLEPIAFILLAARGYLSMRYGAGRAQQGGGQQGGQQGGGPVPDWVVDAYAKLIRQGLLRDVPPAGDASGGDD